MKLMVCFMIQTIFIVGSTKTGEKVCKSTAHESFSILAARKKYPPIRFFANMRCSEYFTEEEIRESESRHVARIFAAFRPKEENK